MAPPFSLQFPRRETEVHGGLSCEIVSDLCPNPFSHDWHVQPSCQRPNRLPPERRASRSRRTRLLGRTQERIRLSSKLINHIVRVKPCQPAHPTAFPRVFHTRNLFWIGRLGELRSSTARNDMAFRLDSTTHRRIGAGFLGQAKAEDRKLRKDPNGGPCFEGTLQKPTSCFRIKSRGRDDLRTLHSLQT
jgi:hypothetical protein